MLEMQNCEPHPKIQQDPQVGSRHSSVRITTPNKQSESLGISIHSTNLANAQSTYHALFEALPCHGDFSKLWEILVYVVKCLILNSS